MRGRRHIPQNEGFAGHEMLRTYAIFLIYLMFSNTYKSLYLCIKGLESRVDTIDTTRARLHTRAL